MIKNKLLQTVILVFLFVILVPTFNMASNPIDDPDSYEPGSVTNSDVNVITSKANNIIGAVTTVGVVISVITLCILGIKYMIGSVEEKAEYKKSMIPYLIGAVLLFATSTVVSIIAKLVQNTDLVG